MDFTLSKLASILGVEASGEALLSGVAVDSRRVRPGDLFVALRGARVDGHGFARDAAAAGARAVLAQQTPENLPPGYPVVRVPDPRLALLQLAGVMKKEAGFRLAAVGGSAGKTTTKEFAAAILSGRFAVEKTPGNQNSAVGFPMSIVNLTRWPEWMVGEMGMSAVGEISLLSRTFEPDVALLTLIAAEHLEFLGTLDNVAKANAEILEGLKPGGTFVVNADDARIVALAGAFRGRTLRFGRGASAEVAIEGIQLNGAGSRFGLRAPEGRVEVALPLPGMHQAANFLAASALAIASGASVEDCAATAPSLKPAPHRGEIHRHSSGATLYDDAYNASPPSMRAALDLLYQLPGTRKIAVLGDMLELGSEDAWFHRETGGYAAARADEILCVGPRARAIAQGAQEEGFPPDRLRTVESPEEAAALLATTLASGDVVLFKASRGVGLERAVKRLMGRSSRDGR
ncbi:MAG TPA: UDP-N-acetylmuramoyl-tripeptide--D-alanyl-D-alanine ligase [Thermoanaerobaculia bacterium]|jgi:UDP-N-acetylmuramoyl-tripeptide--D-alanyl-D-alanine ligase|nr:UDP-N-acetylmuramoyl-tripeptide--D-alanyl-D-alanine ligase [Thermoanaerobaculia bacterium]